MGEVIYVDFATRSPRPAAPLWPEGEVDNIISFEEKKLEFQKKKEQEAIKFTPADLDKLEYFSALLDFPGLTMTTINSHCAGLVLPDALKGRTNLRLSWSYKSGVKNFQFDQWGIKGGLSFGKNMFFVEVPWAAVWQVFKADDPLASLKIWPVIEQGHEEQNTDN